MSTPATGGGLEAKHYILAAFTAGFIAVAVVTIAFVVLSPAHVSFSFTSVGSHDISNGGVQLDLTIAANNTSRRAAVLYQSIVVYLENGTNLLRANVSDNLPLEQPRHNVTEIHASRRLVDGILAENFTGNKTSHSGFGLQVTAVVRFKIGVACTKLYVISLQCPPVDFFANKSSTADCHDRA